MVFCNKFGHVSVRATIFIIALIAYFIYCFVNVYKFMSLTEDRKWEKDIEDLSVLAACLDDLSQINLKIVAQDI
jgi:hypothetical protein